MISRYIAKLEKGQAKQQNDELDELREKYKKLQVTYRSFFCKYNLKHFDLFLFLFIIFSARAQDQLKLTSKNVE